MKPSEIVRERGWIQGHFDSPNGVCVSVALSFSCHGTVMPCSGRCTDLGQRTYLAMNPAVGGSLICWNDVRGRTIEQVIALLQEFEVDFDAAPAEISAPVDPVAVPA